MKKVVLVLILIYSSAFSKSLDDYIKIAIDNNPEIKSIEYKYNASKEDITQSSKLQDPSFSVGYFVSSVETRVGPQRAKFSLSQMLPWFGTLELREEQSQYFSDAVYQDLLDIKGRIKYDVKKAYFPIYELKKKISLFEENIKILETYKNMSEIKYFTGKGEMKDILRIELSINELRSKVQILYDKVKPFEQVFNRVLNIDINSSVDISSELNIPIVDKIEIASHPILSKLDMNIKQNETNIKIAHKEGMPNIGVGLDYVLLTERSDMAINENGKDVIMPMITFSLPIFREKYNSIVNERELEKLSLTYKKLNISNTLNSEYDIAFSNYQSSESLYKLYKSQQSKTLEIIDLLYVSYSNNKDDIYELLKTQQSYIEFQIAELSALIDANNNLAKIEYLTTKEL